MYRREILSNCHAICRSFGDIRDESSYGCTVNDSVGYYEDDKIKIHCSADSFCKVWIRQNGWTMVYDAPATFVEPKVYLKGKWVAYVKQKGAEARIIQGRMYEEAERQFQERLKANRKRGAIDDSGLFD